MKNKIVINTNVPKMKYLLVLSPLGFWLIFNQSEFK
jgi:hypothetical protein